MNSFALHTQPGHAKAPGRAPRYGRAQSNSAPAEPEASGRPLRVVIADDSPSVLKALTSLLEDQTGVQLVGSATDGFGALRRVLELRPDLVLIDLWLPGINGLEATRLIKARSHAPAVILLTADNTPGSREAARAAGTDGFVDNQHLFTELRPALRRLFPEPGLLLRCHEDQETIGDW